MKYFYVYYKSGSVGRCMFPSLESVIARYKSLGVYDLISSIQEIK